MNIIVNDAHVKPQQLSILCNAFTALADSMRHSLTVRLDNVNVFMEKAPLTLDDLQDDLCSKDGEELIECQVI